MADLGAVLGGLGAVLGRSSGGLGAALGGQIGRKIDQKPISIRDGLRRRFWIDLGSFWGSILGGFGIDLGGFGVDLGRFPTFFQSLLEFAF